MTIHTSVQFVVRRHDLSYLHEDRIGSYFATDIEDAKRFYSKHEAREYCKARNFLDIKIISVRVTVEEQPYEVT